MNVSANFVDLRVRRTQKLLWNALMSLLGEHGLEVISVKEICDRAMVHRTTFYKHFEDKYDLLRKGMREIYDTLAREASIPPGAFSPIDTLPVFISFFTHVERNLQFYRLMLCGEGVGKFQGLLRTYLVELCTTHLQQAARGVTSLAVPLPILAEFCASTVISSTTWWLENDQPYPAEQMACYVQRLLKNGCVVREADLSL